MWRRLYLSVNPDSIYTGRFRVKGYKEHLFIQKKNTIITINVTAPIINKSSVVTPRIFPNRTASRFLVNLLIRLISATPRAKLAVVTIPIAASAFIFCRV